MNSDDPKLTAYALDELDPTERAEIEQLLRDDPAARAELEQTATFAAQLRRELKAEAAGAPLTDGQRAEVFSALDGRIEPAANHAEGSTGEEADARRSKVIAFPRLAKILTAAAALVIASVSVLWLFPAIPILKVADHRSLPAYAPADRIVIGSDPSAGSHSNMVPISPPTLADAPAPSPLELTLKASPQLAGGAGVGELPYLAPAEKPEQSKAARVLDQASANPIPRSDKPASTLTAALEGARQSKSFASTPLTIGGRTASATSANRGRPEVAAVPAPGVAFPSEPPPDPRVALLSPDVGALTKDEIRTRSFPMPHQEGNTEAYDAITDNAFLAVRENPLSTFSIDVDTASYANVRRFLNQQTRPPKGAVRTEELLNYFTYDYPQPEGDAPFSATMEVAACPWAPEHRLVRVGLKGREIAADKRPASNLVFLVDVSGSMQPANKLPLLKKSLAMLVEQLTPEDTVSIAVYAGASGTVLEPTHDKREIRNALDKLESGGSTNGGAGIQLAYRLAEQSFIKGGVNRVILATDGDFNVGVTSQSELTDLIERKAKSGVFLTVLGFGMGNLKDSTLEKLADKGNGNYAYIDTLNEGRKVLVEQMNGTLITIAKDVKIQVEFNPTQAAAYRLIGYENRLLAKEDFNDDKKDAGEIGAGHTVTALYEVVPAGKSVPGGPAVDALKYQASGAEKPASSIQHPASSPELLTLKLRYKAPDGDTSKLLEFPLTDRGETWEKSSRDFRFAAAVAGFGMLLRESPHKGTANWESVRELAVEGRGEDRSGYRGEFLTLLDKARVLAR